MATGAWTVKKTPDDNAKPVAEPHDRRTERHLDFIRHLQEAREECAALRHAGFAGRDAQSPLRHMEQDFRHRAVAFAHWAVNRRHISVDRCAGIIHCSDAALYDWGASHDERAAKGRAAPAPAALGAPANDCLPTTAARVRHHLALFGPVIGVPQLRVEFPDVSWRALGALTKRFRADLDSILKSCSATACIWTCPGAVWAADYAEAPTPIDGIYRYILDVRDLASGCVLASVPCEHADADTTMSVLSSLFLAFGIPLVLKTDNGSHFIADEVRQFLQLYGVSLLLSPAYLPQYNGACEAGHGSIKTRAEVLARRDGRPGRWTCDHVEAARIWANRRTGADREISAEQRFENRHSVSPDERAGFLRAVEDQLLERRVEIQRVREGGHRVADALADAIDRQAIVAVLKKAGILTLTSVPVHQQIPYHKCRSISL